MLAAIEIYNKPRLDYRDELVVILLVNAWELALKAMLSKNGQLAIGSASNMSSMDGTVVPEATIDHDGQAPPSECNIDGGTSCDPMSNTVPETVGVQRPS